MPGGFRGSKAWRSVRSWLAAFCAVGAASPVPAAVFPLDVGQSFSDVLAAPPEVAPKLDKYSRFLIYAADSETDELFELYFVPLFGGLPTKISGAMSPGDAVTQFEVSPYSAIVAFIASHAPAPAELFVWNYPGPLNHALGDGEFIDRFAISSDDQFIVYRAKVDDGTFQLFRVRLNDLSGPQPYLFTPPFDCAMSVDDFEISGDSEWVAFRAIPVDCPGEAPEPRFLYRAPILGAASLVWAVDDEGEIPQFGFTTPVEDELSWIVFIDDPGGAGQGFDASLRWDGGIFGAGVISGSAVDGGNVVSFQPVPFSQYVVFLADREVDGTFELFRTTAGPLPDAPTPLQLHEDLSNTLRLEYAVTYFGSQVVFIQDDDVGGGVLQEMLMSASVESPGLATFLEMAISPREFGRFGISLAELDHADVVFLADRDTPGRVELFSVPVEGGLVTKLNPTGNPLVVEWDVLDFAISPPAPQDLSVQVRFVYDAELQVPPFTATSQILSSPIAGGGSTNFGPTLDPTSSDGFDEVFAPYALFEAQVAVVLGDATTPGRRQLYVSDGCVFCDGFLGQFSRWEVAP